MQQSRFDEALLEFNVIKSQLNLDTLTKVKNGYSRNIISIKDNFYMLLLNWDAGIKTKIHGHPNFAFVLTVSGEIINIPYTLNPLTQKTQKNYQIGKYFHNENKSNAMDNYPHQIQINIPSISLHFYSADSSKGIIFE